MTKEILINSSIGETRMALRDAGIIKEIRLFRDHNPSYVGAIYLGRITKVSSEFQAAFIDLGNNLNGFLPLKSLPKFQGKKPKDLTTLVQEGQRIIVQVTADAPAGKSLKLTGRVEILSTSIVLHPFREGAFVSSRIKDPDKRAELKQFGIDMALEHIGLTFRTEAETIAIDQLDKTAGQLINHWRLIMQNIDKAKCPSLLTQGPNPIEQIMREFTTADITNIIVDHASALKTATQWAKSFAPDLSEKISLHKEKEPLFSHYDIDDEIELVGSPNIPLPSGAWITIEETEALTVIDVNMGDAQISSDNEKQIFSVNQQAAREIFRQLRLRGIGGIIVIDFIDIGNKGQIKSFLHFIDELMLGDPEPVQRGNISSFGLLELTRKSRQHNLNSLLLKKSVLSKNTASECLDLLRDCENQAKNNLGQPIRLKLNNDQKKWLENNSHLFDDFLSRTGSPITMDK
ncbi:MAG: S1 RNA-binding domain-containing protein [Kordiimonadaceae bacterium]|jgi:ribonuclease G|nr:S1 RNA-binding domain-containing protein [Kordiimonadaceae bacterium]